MSRTAREPLGVPDPRLDVFRGGVARLFLGEESAGVVRTRVTPRGTHKGILRRRIVDVREAVEWWAAFDPQAADEILGCGCIGTDGVAQDVDAVLQAYERGVFDVYEVELRAEWLAGDQAQEAMREYDLRQ